MDTPLQLAEADADAATVAVCFDANGVVLVTGFVDPDTARAAAAEVDAVVAADPERGPGFADQGFDDLVDDAASAPVDGWDFSWLDGRALEERPTWRYFDLVAAHAERADRLLDVETGTGNLLADLPALPPVAVATDAYPPSIAHAAPRLRARGASLVQTAPADRRLPFRPGSFDLVTSRHPIDTDWTEIARVVAPGGRYLSQQVGPNSLRQLSERFLGPLPPDSRRDPARARRAAEKAGLVVERLEAERPRTVFHDVGAVVYFLRVVVWIVPDFTVDRYRTTLRQLHDHITERGAFEATASRYLISARKPT